MIYTTYFAHLGTVEIEKSKQVSVARGTPKWFSGIAAEALMPSWDKIKSLKHDKITQEEFEVYYNEVLSKLNPASVYSQLDECVLICWEKPSDFCHRHLIADWLEDNGFECKEI